VHGPERDPGPRPARRVGRDDDAQAVVRRPVVELDRDAGERLVAAPRPARLGQGPAGRAGARRRVERVLVALVRAVLQRQLQRRAGSTSATPSGGTPSRSNRLGLNRPAPAPSRACSASAIASARASRSAACSWTWSIEQPQMLSWALFRITWRQQYASSRSGQGRPDRASAGST
jgi:hypothetical protein